VQLYIRDEVSSIARPLRELKRFERISLKPGEKKIVNFVLVKKDLSFLDNHMKPIIEAGSFEVTIAKLTEKFKVQ
ncbi:MAG: fibronectin type III-like domain-contianing protein, partial [Pseudomonadota bacterium]